MSYRTVAAVSETLIELLRDNVGIPPGEIVLSSPGELQEQARLTLFLYSIVENPYLKNDERRMLNSRQTQFAPLSLDIYYLLTSHEVEAPNSDPILDAHEMLGNAMRIFYDNGIISGSLLKGTLEDPAPEENVDENPELRLTLNPITVEDLTRIWSVFPNKSYRISVSYLVTPARIVSTKDFEATRVISKQVDNDHLVPERNLIDGTPSPI